MSDKKIKFLGQEWDEETIKEIAEEEVLKITPSLCGEDSKDKLAKMIEEMTDTMNKMGKAEGVLNFLEIPSFAGKVDAAQLVAILMDETKFQQLVSKLKNKMFW